MDNDLGLQDVGSRTQSNETCYQCKHWHRLGMWWGKCGNDQRTAIETIDPGAGPEMTRQFFSCSAFQAL